ncbi:hypothetical protein [Pseudomonas fluorescens]|uniref:Uncharacterized protein n=1 Tax=Pseudomonas fluorescens TaxID=294 RepID=A0A5E7AGF0_PSEFL|nr:hypothetical protein [Pseudomonas fluorescens]VVN75497.1 hypothetical protein PS691_00700 [Pseudomonas fluorescens]
MKHSHAKCLKAAIAATKCQGRQQAADDHFTALIDGVSFTAQDIRGFISFGVRMVVGVIYEGNNRRYISVAADDDLGAGEYDVSLDGKVTIGYIIENAGEPSQEYPAEHGKAGICCATHREFSGSFNVKLVEGLPYKKITEATFKVSTLHRLS